MLGPLTNSQLAISFSQIINTIPYRQRDEIAELIGHSALDILFAYGADKGYRKETFLALFVFNSVRANLFSMGREALIGQENKPEIRKMYYPFEGCSLAKKIMGIAVETLIACIGIYGVSLCLNKLPKVKLDDTVAPWVLQTLNYQFKTILTVEVVYYLCLGTVFCYNQLKL